MRGSQHCDNTTRIDHLVPNTGCSEVFKGVVDDAARAVFQGKIVFHRDAQHTNGHQLSKVLLLSDKAEIDTKPELEIYANGAARTLLTAGNAALIERAIPHLTSRDPATVWTSGQWMTETTGGSDVGASLTSAVRDEQGRWR